MFRVVFYFLFIYLIYRGIQFVFRIFAAINSGDKSGNQTSNETSSASAKSKFKDVEEAHYTEIKDDQNKDPN